MIELKRNGNIINKKYLEYFWPTVLVALASNIAVMVDSIIVGNMLGSASMAAISVLSPINQLYFSTTILFGVGASTLISFAKGKNDKKAADAAFTAAAILLVILSAAFMILQLVFVNNIVDLLTPIEKRAFEILHTVYYRDAVLAYTAERGTLYTERRQTEIRVKSHNYFKCDKSRYGYCAYGAVQNGNSRLRDRHGHRKRYRVLHYAYAL